MPKLEYTNKRPSDFERMNGVYLIYLLSMVGGVTSSDGSFFGLFLTFMVFHQVGF